MYDAAQDMEYLDMVVQETLRLYPVVPVWACDWLFMTHTRVLNASVAVQTLSHCRVCSPFVVCCLYVHTVITCISTLKTATEQTVFDCFSWMSILSNYSWICSALVHVSSDPKSFFPEFIIPTEPLSAGDEMAAPRRFQSGLVMHLPVPSFDRNSRGKDFIMYSCVPEKL